MKPKELLVIARATLKDANKDDLSLLAAGLTYYVFLSIFPLLLLGLTVTANVMGKQSAEELVFKITSQAIPGASKSLESIVAGAFENRDFFYVVGMVTLLFSASSAFGTLDKAINRAWNTEKVPGFIVSRLVSFLMMLVFSALLAMLLVGSAIISAAQNLTNTLFGKLPGSAFFWNLLDIGVSLTVVFLGLVLIYRFLPRIDVQFRDVWLAALMAAIAWVLLKQGFALYLGSSLANYDVVYGTLGTVVALLFWIYVSSLIILYGAEFGSETYNIRTRHAKLVEQATAGQFNKKWREKGSPWFPTLKR
jgi:membrane protein